MNIINDRVKQLRAIMNEKNIDMYFIPTSDFHDSEYVGDYFRGRAWLSGFTGSAGVMVVDDNKAVVWSDGRYFIQAENQLSNTCIDFYRQGEKEYPTLYQYVIDNLADNGVLAFDGKVVSSIFGENLERGLKDKNITFKYDEDLLSFIWKDRPSLPTENIFVLDTKYSGEDATSKIERVRKKLIKYQVDKFVLTSLDDIAWLLNIRGNDVVNNPVVLSYLMMDQKEINLYVDINKIDNCVQQYLSEIGVIVKPYEAIYDEVKEVSEEASILIDKERVNYSLLKSMKAKIVNKSNPTTYMKAIKNDVELENLKEAHIKDGVAVTKFMYWLKSNVGKVNMDEITLDKYLLECRRSQSNFIEESFEAIVAYNANAAMMHYTATNENKASVEAKGMLLVDSGGQYLEGTTDITRTFGLGKVDAAWIKDFTLTLKGMIQLSKIKFLEGCTGVNLDILARQPLWECNIDYKCGTGHGVGYLLNVHEGPHGIRWRKALNRKEDTELKPGMVVTNEPGVYVEGSHGIRIENMLYITEDVKNEYGQFLRFETLTYAPIDLDLINANYLDDDTKMWLNNYHQDVYKKISPALNEEEKAWLKEYTRAI